MELSLQEMQWAFGAFDTKPTGSTLEAQIKGSMLIKFAQQLEAAQAEAQAGTDNKEPRKPKSEDADKKKVKVGETTETERDLGVMVSILTKAVQQLTARLEAAGL